MATWQTIAHAMHVFPAFLFVRVTGPLCGMLIECIWVDLKKMSSAHKFDPIWSESIELNWFFNHDKSMGAWENQKILEAS